MKQIKFKLSFTKKAVLVLVVMLFSLVFTGFTFNPQLISAHSPIAYPAEIFSIWNNTSPTLDGSIDFNPQNTSKEWAYAAVYDLYDENTTVSGKLFLQNDNESFFIGLDVISFETEDPVTDWGMTIYFDVDHNGFLSDSDKSIYFVSNSSDDFVIYRDYSISEHGWTVIESNNPETSLPSGIYLATDFSQSAFENDTDHRQYEIEVPFTTISSGTGKSSGIAIEVTNDFATNSAGITWPFIEDNLFNIRTQSSVWGDISFGEKNRNSFDFLIEDNLNVKDSAIGYNNGTYIITADIDGDGDSELIVSSNRSVLGDKNLLAIFDYVSGGYQRIWSSWTTSHQDLIDFTVLAMAAFDFDEDGKDEIFAVGIDRSILRFNDWNSSKSDFETSEVIFEHSNPLMGYLEIGDASNDFEPDLVFGDQNGYLNILEYSSGTDTFNHDSRSPSRTKIDGSYPYRIHEIELGNIDSDNQIEILFNYQYSADNQLSETLLLIYERSPAKYLDNLDDDLPAISSVTTADYFGHTIIVADVDNDSVNETIIVGKNYLRVFEQNSFTDSSPPLEFLVNDETTEPLMAGGATVGDINNDGINELIFGANNGTLYIGRVVDNGTALSFHLNWSADLGSSLGYHGSMLVEDFDGDGINELAVGDNSGQIFIIGKGDAPELTITNPSSGYVSSQDHILVTWDASDDHQALHYVDIYVNGIFTNRLGGAQTGTIVYLSPGQNSIEVDANDFSGLNTSKIITVKFNVKAPQVTITTPTNYFETSLSYVDITYYNTDPDGDFDHYKIFLNGDEIENDTIDESYRLDLSSSGEGEMNITIVAIDDTLLEGRASLFIIRDISAPNLTISSPSDGAAIKTSELEFTWTANDTHTDVEYFDIKVDGVLYDTTTDYSATINFGIDKEFLVEIIAYDSLGHSVTSSVTITRDLVSPTVSFDPIGLPKLIDGTFYTNNPNLFLSWNATDNEFGSGIISSRITINGLLYDTYPAETQEATINLGNDSYKNIYVITYDKAGNSAENNFAVILDRLAPTLLIDNPENNFTSGLNYTIVTWNANDAGVGVLKYDILIDGAIDVTIADPDTNLYYVLLPIPKTYNITVRVTDVLGYSFEQTINVTYDPLAPTILITSPTSMESYSNSSTITVNWDINNLIIDHFEIYYNDTHVGNYTSTIFTAEIYFADIIPNEYQVYNVTIYAITTEAKIYSDFHWIIIDQVAPTISISSPGSINPILDYDLQIEWFGEDEKSGIEIFVIEISTTSIIKSSNSVSHILDVTGLDGFYNLTIIASDVAGNKASDTVEIQIALLIPDFITTLEPITIQNDFEIQFNLTITNPRLGIKSISIYADGSENVYTVSYGTNYVTVPFWLLVNTSASDFQGNSGLHNMSISVIDRVNRETKKNYAVVIDQENPEFWPGQDPVLGSIVLSTSTNEVFWNDEPSSNIYDLKIFIKELYGLSGVNISIVGDGYDETYQMIHNVVNSHDEHHQYDIKLDFNDLSIGDYSLIFSFKDTAGNSNNKAFSLSLKAAAIPTTPTTVIEPTNSFLYIILGASLAIVLAFVFSLTLRQPLSNIGWQKELVVVVFVLRSGLTAVFVPYSHEITTDEQLFGGAMSGIRGILEEIIGMRGKAEVEKVEFGDKTLLICPGEFGDAVLLVHKDKPIHSKLLSNFAAAFEEEYVDALQNDTHVNFSQYEGTIELIESFFGPIEDLDLQLPLQAEVVTNAEIVEPMKIDPKESLLGSFYQEIFATNDQFIEISDKTKVFIGDAIILVEQSLNALISRDFKMAEGKAKTALKSLEFARQSKEPVGDFSKLIRVLPRIAEIVLNGAESSKRGDTKEVHMAIEMASQLFLEQIT